MFNRRHLRIKALQAVFNYNQKEKVAYQLGVDEISQAFKPDLNSMEPQNLPLLKKHEKEAKQIFAKQYRNKVLDVSASPEVMEGLRVGRNFYQKSLIEEKKNISDFLLKDVNNVWHNYISILKFMDDLAKHIDFLFHNNDNKRFQADINKNDFRLAWSPVFDLLRQTDEYVSYTNKHTFLWETDDSILKNFYRETLIKSDRYQAYQQAESSDELDCKLLIDISRKLLLKNQSVADFFDEQDPFWDENQEIVIGMLTKTFKKLKNHGDFELIRLSPNWEEDKEYLFDLLKLGLNCPEEITQRIEQKTKNWDLERLANTDRHILELALQEMIEFPSIPVKVTINEYLEVAKKYSSPQSKQFINGVLDVISKEMIADKTIRKSGRGLIDNK